MNFNLDHTSFKKVNSKQSTDLNVKHKTIKLPGNDLGENLGDFVFGNEFLETTPTKTLSMREKNKLKFMKIKNVCPKKDT